MLVVHHFSASESVILLNWFLACLGWSVMESSLLPSKSELRAEVVRVLNSPLMQLQISITKRIVLGLFWILLHLAVSIVHLLTRVTHSIEGYVISVAQPDKYQHLQLNKLRYLAVVVDSEEALTISKVVDLLSWLSAIGIKHVSLYDAEGVLKRNKEILLKNVNNVRLWQGADEKGAPKEKMALEVLSFSDGKEATAKAASFLYSEFLQATSSITDQNPTFSEADMDKALKAVGCWGPEPDLLLIYGEARCHLGFPAWRLRYTELVHMGTLRSMKYGAMLKAIYEFTKVQQNYGT